MEQIESVSKRLGEPEWVLNWRKKHGELAAQLPAGEKYGIGIVSAEMGMTTEEAMMPPAYRVDAIAKELELYTWREAIAQDEVAPILRGLLESPLLPAPTTRASALAAAAFADGLVVYAMPSINDDGTPHEELLALETTAKGNSADLVVVIAKQGVHLKLVNHVRADAHSTFLRKMLVILEQDAVVTIVEDGEGTTDAAYFVDHAAIVGAHSRILLTETPWTARAYKTETNTILVGEAAASTVTHAIVADAAVKGEGVYDVWSKASHIADETRSRIVARGVGIGRSRTVYRGLIDMKEGVRAVDGMQDGRFLMLSPEAEVDAIPSLDIASKDVASVHKLSISHIRDIDLFYPKLRGYSDEEGKEVVIEGHFSGLDNVDEGAIMEKVRRALGAAVPHA